MERGDFDAEAMFEALDELRRARGLSWAATADAIWQQSSALNATRDDRPIIPATPTGLPRRRNTSCQHALFVLRWLDRTPERVVPGRASGPDSALPLGGPDVRLRWSLPRLFAALDRERPLRRLTWSSLVGQWACSPNQLTGLRTDRFATGMVPAMRITGWLDMPATAFIVANHW
jgi:hypothetical protein